MKIGIGVSLTAGTGVRLSLLRTLLVESTTDAAAVRTRRSGRELWIRTGRAWHNHSDSPEREAILTSVIKLQINFLFSLKRSKSGHVQMADVGPTPAWCAWGVNHPPTLLGIPRSDRADFSHVHIIADEVLPLPLTAGLRSGLGDEFNFESIGIDKISSVVIATTIIGVSIGEEQVPTVFE